MEDGSIPQVEMTSCGLNGKPLKGKGTYSTSIACNLFSKEGAVFIQGTKEKDKHPYFTQNGVDREEHPDQHIANMKNGSVAGFKYFDLQGTKEISVETRGSGGTLKVMNGCHYNAAILAQIPLQESEGYKSSFATLKGGTEKTAMFFKFEGKGRIDFKAFTLY